jgi:hypothetical protein
MAERSDEPLAIDLIGEPEPDPEPQLRKVGVRRVTGWSTSNRLLSRGTRRPAGNSSTFWSRIEDDDPFARRRPPTTRHLADHDVYPAGRLERVEKIKIEKGRVVPARQSERLPPTPRPESRPPPRRESPPPKPKHQAEPPPRPSQPARAAQPPPRTPQAPAAPPSDAPPLDRRPPRIIKKGSSKRTGRVRIGRSAKTPQQEAPPARSAAAIRAEKQAERKSTEPDEAPQLRNLDGVLSALGALAAAQGLFEENKDRKDRGEPLLGEPVVTPDPRPSPTPPRAPKPRPKPKQAAPPVDRRPPMPAKPATPPKPAPSKPASAGGMDDLFGGGPSEGRVRIGRRTKPKPKPTEG